MDTTIRPGDQHQTADELEAEWAWDPRWSGVRRDYTADDVVRLRGPALISSVARLLHRRFELFLVGVG